MRFLVGVCWLFCFSCIIFFLLFCFAMFDLFKGFGLMPFIFFCFDGFCGCFILLYEG